MTRPDSPSLTCPFPYRLPWGDYTVTSDHAALLRRVEEEYPLTALVDNAVAQALCEMDLIAERTLPPYPGALRRDWVTFYMLTGRGRQLLTELERAGVREVTLR